jgi:Ca2+-binding RTX toxin-like protein
MAQNILPAEILALIGLTRVTPENGLDRPDIQIYPLGGNHYYQGLGGNDTITGGFDTDYIEGGAGADILADLGGSNDTLGYFNSEEGVSLVLNILGGFAPGAASGGAAEGDTAPLGGFENLVARTRADSRKAVLRHIDNSLDLSLKLYY